MQVSTVHKIHRPRNSEKEVEVRQPLSILEYIAANNANVRILKNGVVLSVQEHDVSQIEDTNNIRDLFRALF